MTRTSYSSYSTNKIAKELTNLLDCSKDILKLNQVLAKKDGYWPKPLFEDVMSLANRFVELYKDNKWKIKSNSYDDFFMSNIKDIGNLALEMSDKLGKEKHSYVDYSLFLPWEGIYANCRDYCNTLSLLEEISVELKGRYFSDGVRLGVHKKPPNKIVLFVNWIINSISKFVS